MTSPPLGPKLNFTQNIKYVGSETEFTTEVKGDNVIVHCLHSIQNHGSSKVILMDRIDFNWEFRYYHGHLVAAHIGGKIVAYGMKGKDGGMVRVTNQETSTRTLIKNLKEDIKDIAFSYSRDDVILGCVDSEGNILIYQIEDTPNSISYTLLLHIYHCETNGQKINYRIVWCPYLQSFDEEDSSDDPEKMFVILNGNKAEVCNVAIMMEKYGKGTVLDPNDSYEGYIEINNKSEVVDGSFSADGTAIAIALMDGYVKFYQLYMFDNPKQKCLHEWKPHKGEPLSSIIFIDNVLEYSTECWKFVITGANNNADIKLWSCESWTCLQTIHFKSDPSSPITNLYLKVAVDYTGQFLVMSDINNRVLYVLQLKRNDKEKLVQVTNLAQFLLPAPFLSYHILEAAVKDVPINSNEYDVYDDQDDFDDEPETAVCLKMLVIQPKKFQECNITYQPEDIVLNTCLNESNVDLTEEKDKILKLGDLQESVNLLIQREQSNSNLTLMTPDDFTPPGRSTRPSSDNKPNDELKNEIVADLIDFNRPQKDNFASGGSSPSREVQEIFSLNNSSYSTQDYFDNLANIQSEQVEQQDDYNNQNEDLVYQDGEMGWPKIPVVKENDIIKDEKLRKELRLADDQSVNYRLTALESLIREQNILLQKFHQDSIEKEKLLENTLSKHYLQLTKYLENILATQRTEFREYQEQLLTNVTQILTKILSEKIQQIISKEIEHVMVPAVNKLAESYRSQVDGQYSQKLSGMDALLKENVAKAFNNKALADSLSLSVVNVVAPSLEKCYKDIITSSLIPSWERVCGQMFQQINETFTRGTKEYTASVENYMDKQRRVQEKGKDLITQMQSVLEVIKNNSDKLSGNLASEFNKQFSTSFKGIQDQLTQNIRDIITEQIKLGFKSHASVIEDSVKNAVCSRAVTPSPNVESHFNIITQIQQHLSRNNYSEAFQIALGAENQSYVIFVCEKVDAQTIFEEESGLPQNCVLALIQQLSVELHKNTDLKLRFIQAAILALQYNDSNIKRYIPKVLNDLYKQLKVFISSNPSRKHLNDAKMLLIVVESKLMK